MRVTVLIAALTLAGAGAALANDTTASTGAGGLVLEKTDAIAMASEDLYVSAEQIRIRYLFRNLTAAPVSAIVAFPMPERKMSDEYGGDVAYPSGFRTMVEGRPVKTALERKAIARGRDHKALLESLRIPVAPDSINEATRAMDRLAPAQKARLIAAGLAGEEEYDDDGKGMKKHLIPLWSVQDRYWWRQVFPAGRGLRVEHRYVPGAGGSVTTPLAFKELRNTADGRWAKARYCPDAAFFAALDRHNRNPDQDPGLPDRRIDYVLTTGGNWARPIGDFRLVVDKGKPGNFVSFCETGVRKISPTQFEVRHRNWRPTRDLNVLIVEPRR
jgi:hypothetical protein